jgi:hypothetical protein
VGRREPGKPEQPAVAREALAAAVQRFVTLFVMESRRERMASMLTHRDPQRRIEAIQHVYKWIDRSVMSELGGGTGSPQQLGERFRDVRGLLIDGSSAHHVAVADAATMASVGFGGIFIADGVFALLSAMPHASPTNTLTSRLARDTRAHG